MGDGDHRTGILLEMLFQPVDRLGVEVVGRLVEQKYVGLLEQQAAEGHAAALASREGVDFLVIGRTLEGIHSPLQLGIDIPGVGGVESVLKFPLALDELVHLVGVLKHVGVPESHVHLVELPQQVHNRLHTLADNLDDGLFRVELRFLFKVTDGVAGSENDLSLIVLVDSGNDFQQGGLSGTVQTDNADLGAVKE